MKPRTAAELAEQERADRYAEANIRRDKARGYPAPHIYELTYSTDGRCIDSEHMGLYRQKEKT